GRDDAGELDERPIAHQLDDAPAMGSDARHDDLPIGLQPVERARLIQLHEARIAHNVSRHDGGQLALQDLCSFTTFDRKTLRRLEALECRPSRPDVGCWHISEVRYAR